MRTATSQSGDARACDASAAAACLEDWEAKQQAAMAFGPQPPKVDDPNWKHLQILAGDLRVHLVEEGAGPSVLLLHGFPDFWYSWRYQIRALAGAGFRVLVPDLRGYNLTEKPSGVRAYGLDRLVDDVANLVEWAGGESAHIVGHDWGGIIAWYAAMRRPEIIDRLVVLNAPHPDAYQRELGRSNQRWRSWYGAFFQIPWLPEALMRARNYEAIASAIAEESRNPEGTSPEVIQAYREAMAEPGALSAAINYYRAVARPWARELRDNRRAITAETLLLWGEKDPFLVRGNSLDLESWVPNIQVEHVPDAGHWVHCDEPLLVNERLINFLSKS